MVLFQISVSFVNPICALNTEDMCKGLMPAVIIVQLHMSAFEKKPADPVW